MPRCVDCGTETPREELLGPPDELRCRACVNKRYPVYDDRPVRREPLPPFITYGVVVASVIASLVFWVRPDFVEWGILDPRAIWELQLWRLVTTAFFHANPTSNPMHLIFNLYFIWVFGRPLESWMGPVRFAGFFILLAAGSSAGQVLGGAGGIGLSGVGFGMFGLLYALRRYKDFAAMLMQPSTVQILVFWFFLCIVLTYMNVWQVANIAHGVGAVLGWLLGRAVLAGHRVWLIAGVCVLVVAEIAATQYMPWNAGYDIFRGNRCLHRADYQGALYWLDKALQLRPQNEGLRVVVQELRQEVQSADP
jgi:membrane associated rhomboid family serine protease